MFLHSTGTAPFHVVIQGNLSGVYSKSSHQIKSHKAFCFHKTALIIILNRFDIWTFSLQEAAISLSYYTNTESGLGTLTAVSMGMVRFFNFHPRYLSSATSLPLLFIIFVHKCTSGHRIDTAHHVSRFSVLSIQCLMTIWFFVFLYRCWFYVNLYILVSNGEILIKAAQEIFELNFSALTCVKFGKSLIFHLQEIIQKNYV